MANIANIIQNGNAPPFYLVDAISGSPIYNQDGIVLLKSAAITANSNTDIQVNSFYRGIKVYIAPGSFGSGATAITVSVQCFDPVSLSFFTMLTSASLTASTFATLTVAPGITATSNVSAADVLPRSWRVAWAASNWGTGGSTLGISCALIL